MLIICKYNNRTLARYMYLTMDNNCQYCDIERITTEENNINLHKCSQAMSLCFQGQWYNIYLITNM